MLIRAFVYPAAAAGYGTGHHWDLGLFQYLSFVVFKSAGLCRPVCFLKANIQGPPDPNRYMHPAREVDENKQLGIRGYLAWIATMKDGTERKRDISRVISRMI